MTLEQQEAQPVEDDANIVITNLEYYESSSIDDNVQLKGLWSDLGFLKNAYF